MRSYKAVCKGRKTSANHISFAAVGSHQMTHNSGNIIKDTHTPTNTNARTHCFFFFSLKGKYLHRQKHTRATRKWMCNACVAKGPRGFSYWFPCSAFYAHKHGLAPGDVQMLVLFISRCCALYCTVMECFTVTTTTAALCSQHNPSHIK